MTRSRPPFGRLAVGVLLVGGAVAFLVFQATGDNLTYYRTVDELLASPAAYDESIRISGDVAPGSVERAPGSSTIRFAITSTTPDEAGAPPTSPRRIPVEYGGTVPDIFRPGIQVVVEGRMHEDGTFRAETLLAKCPSKYQAAGDLDRPASPPAD